MSDDMAIRLKPHEHGYRATHPGRILRSELEARGMTQADLAARMGRPPQVINQIAGEKKAVTAETARGLEHVLGVPRHVWMNLQSNYELAVDRLKEEERLEAEGRSLLDALGAPTIREMVKRGWIERRDSVGGQVSELLSFFAVQSLTGLERTHTGAAFRVTPGAKVEPWRLAAWMRGGEIAAEQLDLTAEFDPDAFADLLPRLRADTRSAAPWPKLRDRCAEVGVAVVVEPALTKSGANGVTYWLGRERPVIQLSLRNKRADIFWFTFFHEAAHVLEGYRSEAIIDLDDMPRESEAERAADRFAADALIPPHNWRMFLNEEPITDESIASFADAMGIHPGIVVGRLQFEKLIPYNRHNNLRDELTPDLFSAAVG